MSPRTSPPPPISMKRHLTALASSLALFITSQISALAGPTLEAVTFASDPGSLYVPLQEVAQALHWVIRRNPDGQCTQLHLTPVPPGSLRQLGDGRELLHSLSLQQVGATLLPLPGHTLVRRGRYDCTLVASPKRVEVNLATQQLRAWQGPRLVLQSHISSGRNGRTPTGQFRVGPFRARMHYSNRYQRAPMPYSVQINGHIFIHGYSSVPHFPASHGCIRLPLDGLNPAKFFFEWVDNGSPVQVLQGSPQNPRS